MLACRKTRWCELSLFLSVCLCYSIYHSELIACKLSVTLCAMCMLVQQRVSLFQPQSIVCLLSISSHSHLIDYWTDADIAAARAKMHFNPDFLTSDAGSVSTGAGPAMSMEDRVLLFKQNLRPVSPLLLNTMYFQVCVCSYWVFSLTNIA